MRLNEKTGKQVTTTGENVPVEGCQKMKTFANISTRNSAFAQTLLSSSFTTCCVSISALRRVALVLRHAGCGEAVCHHLLITN